MSQVTHNSNRFEWQENGQVAIADYYMSGQTVVVTHIVVPESLRGRGVASNLAAGIVNHARSNNLKVRPLCSFMVAYMNRHKETNDLLDE